MDNSDLQDKRQKLIALEFWTIAADRELTLMLLTVCKEFLGYGPTSCAKELLRYFNELVKTDKMTEKVKSKYRLKEGQLLYSNGQHYSNANLTDEIAEALLKHTPALVNAFEVIPKEPEPVASEPKPNEPAPQGEPAKEPEPVPVKKTVKKKTTKK
jgi:hypothetical protein